MLEREREKQKKKKKKKGKSKKTPIKIGFLWWSSKNVKNQKKMIFRKLADTMCVRKGKTTRIFVATICFGQDAFGPKQCKAGNTIKIGVSAEIAKKKKKKKNKNETFFWKKVFLTWLKRWVLLTVFLKSCVS